MFISTILQKKYDHLNDNSIFQNIQRYMASTMYTCCASVLLTSLFIPRQGLLLPLLILTFYLGFRSNSTNLLLEQIVLVFSFLLGIVKILKLFKIEELAEQAQSESEAKSRVAENAAEDADGM